MADLYRSLAPISDAAWSAIDDEAKRVLTLNLAARKLVDFEGPLGWQAAAVNLGRVLPVRTKPADGVDAWTRQVQPLVELRATFDLSRAELEAVGRGAKDPDLDPLIAAATQIARAEDHAVFHGYGPGGIAGVTQRSPHKPVAIPKNTEAYPSTVAEATRLLRAAGVDGPYGIALGPRCWTALMQATERGGYPVLKLVQNLVSGPVVWAPAVDGAIVVSLRGEDYQLSVGQDLSIGYRSHTDTSVRLYLVETVTFRVLTDDAAVWLKY
jgi:uncharacterized linocin/CFP29 family protein